MVEVYRDHAVSGSKGRDKRPAFDRLHKDATRRHFDVVMARSVDRLGRWLDLRETRCELFLHQRGLDTTTSSGRATFGMLSVFAEFERSIIREQVLSGMARAKAKGTRSGKPIGRPAIAPPTPDVIRAEYRTGGVSLRAVARQHSVGVESVRRCLAEIEQRRL